MRHLSQQQHLAVQFVINIVKPDWIRRKITYRKYRGINVQEFIEDLQSSQHPRECEGSVDQLVEVYNKRVQSIITHQSPRCSPLVRKFGGKQKEAYSHLTYLALKYVGIDYFSRRRSVSIPQRQNNAEKIPRNYLN